MDREKVKKTVKISAAIAAVFLLILLAANEANVVTVQEPALESAAVEDAPASPDTVLREEFTTNGQGDYDPSGEAVLGASYATPSGVPADDYQDSADPTDNYNGGNENEDADGQTGEEPDEQEEEEQPGQPEQPYSLTNANGGNKFDLRIAYITIDDGPSRNITPGILDVLAQEGIKATFFVLPHDGVRDLYQRILDEGHEIGNHSYTHVYSKLYNSGDLETFREDVLRARDYIFDNFGYMTTTFRFPGGMMGRSSSIVAPRREILEEIGYRYFDWNIDTGDANSRQTDKSAAALTNNVLRNTLGRDRIIVLMHDTGDKRTTLEALPLIISGLREQGYVFDILRNYEIPDPVTAATATQTSLVTDNTDAPLA